MGMAVAEKFHVLAVDDSVIDRKLIERLLKTSSYQVTTVDSGSKALEFLGFEEQSNISPPSVSPNSENHRHQKDEQVSVSPRIKKAVGVNLVITDYCMPGMTGYDLLKKIKESSSLRNIPVVIMSSENVPSRISRCLEEGAEEFFLKPVRLSDVNKLKPHMLKAMYDDGDQSKEGTSVDNLHKPELLQQQPPEEQQPTDAQQSQQPQQQQSNSGSNKRKSVEANSSTQITVEEGPSPDRTRPRYSGLAVV